MLPLRDAVSLKAMRTVYNDNQLFLEKSITDVLASEWPLSSAITAASRKPAGHALEDRFWQISAEMGWLGLAVDENWGGCSGDYIDLGIFAECAGRFAIPSQTLTAIAGVQALAILGKPEISAPTLRNAVLGDAFVGIASQSLPLNLFAYGDGLALTGTIPFMPQAERATWFVVDARHPDQGGTATFLVPQSSATLLPRATLGGDAYYKAAWDRVPLSDDVCVLVAHDAADGPERRAKYSQLMTALSAMELTGIATALLERTIGYVSEREQAGQRIGSRQTVQHALANVAIRRDQARLASLRALWLLTEQKPAQRAARVAKIAAGDAAAAASEAAQQFWGAMGYARESGLFVWSQRARHVDARNGTRLEHMHYLTDEMSPTDVF